MAVPSFKLRARAQGGHVFVEFYAGEIVGQRGYLGRLAMTPVEWEQLSAGLLDGSAHVEVEATSSEGGAFYPRSTVELVDDVRRSNVEPRVIDL